MTLDKYFWAIILYFGESLIFLTSFLWVLRYHLSLLGHLHTQDTDTYAHTSCFIVITPSSFYGVALYDLCPKCCTLYFFASIYSHLVEALLILPNLYWHFPMANHYPVGFKRDTLTTIKIVTLHTCPSHLLCRAANAKFKSSDSNFPAVPRPFSAQ